MEGLRTWESINVRKGDARLRVTAMPGTHAPAGSLRKVLLPVMGSMLEFAGQESGHPVADVHHRRHARLPTG